MQLYEAEDYIGKERDRAILEKNRKEERRPGGCTSGISWRGCTARLSKS